MVYRLSRLFVSLYVDLGQRISIIYALSNESVAYQIIPIIQTCPRIICFDLSFPLFAPCWKELVAIDKNTHEVVPSEDKLTFESGKLHELQDDLPDNAPRFVLLSYEVCLPGSSFHYLGAGLILVAWA